MVWTWLKTIAVATVAALFAAGHSQAARCGNTGAGFEAWKPVFAAEARANGIGARGISALLGTSYSNGTIAVDRNQRFFHLSLSAFMAKRGADAIIAQGRRMKAANAAMFAALERRFGVPAGPLVAIWGMETGFGSNTGRQNTISAVATLAYDCRRSEYFTDQLYAALKLIDRGVLTAATTGAMHGEVGQTQFLPKNILLYGADGDGDGKVNMNSRADALASTANFLKGNGWPAGEPYRASSFASWNAAMIYQQALAIIGQKIDGE
ncbi:MAG: lytic murein transglycosylase [Rhizobiales bacterium]|nr:lytic murein transglycosylase [Hyphomicrobiales bacterium]MBI3674391.1 lytic murein transglycosylase [Hyphomicrobiales bacterium]